MEKTIKIKGMHCKSCVCAIKDKLESLNGIKSAKVTLLKNEAIVDFDPAKIDLEQIQIEIEKLGYSTGLNFEKKSNNILKGLVYGIVPHIGCIGFILGSVLGVSILMQFFRPLLMSRYFFYGLVALSLGFASVSVLLYLRNNELLSVKGLQRKWKYVTITYGSTVGVNLALFLIVFPMLANVSASVGGDQVTIGSTEFITLRVNIPCSGHAPLISNELKTINGVQEVRYSTPNTFAVKYDSGRTSKTDILKLAVFREYPATVLNETSSTRNLSAPPAATNNSSSGCACCRGK
ncbi:MAG: putative copper-exporting P-type ATPase A [Candidatus Methanofastidiosum methylothiophilum]|uniref:Putative copper-exporting P-type ATPase A n=1 Tax=Candidatus Methanofastidiosum methylothiophilum TaxID=1705564 RepID=A0A150J0Q5_9EURY|nr:MAG: putative copper-exporting P-type ATPase A [Candidatus Methanofastidiosum methylthiophilus]KYC48103.1 MAG: putative copper-exporting P-type ATPase A [Candidatus Methanofastidiosum methylthiophilus]KYC50658.1 MAG: putative copper-exporting P-type ATPase A [Candidatus Methanofastidiosum methylthiophilus]